LVGFVTVINANTHSLAHYIHSRTHSKIPKIYSTCKMSSKKHTLQG